MTVLHRIMRFILTLCMLSVVTSGMSVTLSPDIPKAKAKANEQTQCVEPVAEMRRNHMHKILHQRDATVRKGVRTASHSLKACINCHVSPDAQGVTPKASDTKHFCNSCHQFAGVSIDCFDCHSAAPEQAVKHAR